MPASAMTEPAARSIIPEMISIVMPKEMIVVIEIWREMLERFLAEKKAGLRMLQMTSMATRIR